MTHKTMINNGKNGNEKKKIPIYGNSAFCGQKTAPDADQYVVIFRIKYRKPTKKLHTYGLPTD